MKNNGILGWCVLLLLLAAMISCRKRVTGEGPVVKQDRTPAAFDRISHEIDGVVYVTQEGTTRLTVEAQQNILDILETPVKDGELKIQFKNHTNVRTHDPIIVRISNPVINGLDVEGSGDLLMTNTLQANQLQLDVSGSGSIKAGDLLVAGRLSANISGSGGILALGGHANSGSLVVSGSGWINLLPVEHKTVEADISGSGNIKATVTDRLDARISGSGSVLYQGNPTVDTHVSGSGSVRKA